MLHVSHRLFHTTAAAHTILTGGFRDGNDDYGFVTLDVVGVFLSDLPAGIGNGATGTDVLEVILPADVDLTRFAIVEDGHEPWEWVIPAALLNTCAEIRLLTEREVDAAR